jgi:DHA1 family bicyclomycin/chloramphenicol resistance-like MFS transporter
MGSASFAGLFAWISGSSFVLQSLYGLTPFAFGIAFAVGSVGYMSGTSMAARLVMRHGIDRTLGIGCAIMAAAGLTMVLVVGLSLDSTASIVLPMAVYLAGFGMVLPQSIAGAMTPFPERAGAASSLLGFFQQTLSALVGMVVGMLLGGTAWPLAGAIALMGCISLLIWVTTRGVRAKALSGG